MLAIIMAIKNEEERLFVENIYLNRYEKMYGMAYDILNNREDAQDCVHDVIQTIADNVEYFMDISEISLKRMLSVCTRNAAINRYKQNKKRIKMSITVDEEDTDIRSDIDIPDNDSNVVAIVVNAENARYIHSLVDRLDDMYRDVITLKYFHGVSTERIAKILGISESLVRMRITRGKRKLLELGGDEINDYR